MCEYVCTQFNNVIKFKNIDQEVYRKLEMTLHYQQETYNEYFWIPCF